MIKYTVFLLLGCLTCMSLEASQFANMPYVIGKDTYWLTLDNNQSEKGKTWDFSNPNPPPLLPNEVISIVTKVLQNQKLADKQWKIVGVTLRWTSSNINSRQSTYSYYQIELSEHLIEGTPEYATRMKNGHTTLARIEMAVTMDGEAILPKKGKHLREVSPEAWELYKRRYNIKQSHPADADKPRR